MTTEKKLESTETSTANDNKAVFAPLGKYAIIAVIMVSIIVTTAIMLDKQLNHANQEIAAIEMEVAEMHSAETVSTNEATTEVVEVVIDSTATETTSVKVAVVETKTAEPELVEIKAIETKIVKANITEPSTADILIELKTQAPIAKIDNIAEPAVSAAQFEMATTQSQAQDRQQQLALDNQARIETYKAEHKKNLSDMFARIKTLEAQQLDRYKSNQNDQITHLREQISNQQQMIEALVLRNKDLFELRSANMQRNQANREQVLNRI